jgi:hypothetical protein
MIEQTPDKNHKYMSRKSIVLIIILCNIIISCLPMDKWYIIKITNQSRTKIQYFSSNITDGGIYPDTLLPTNKPYLSSVESNNAGQLTSKIGWQQQFQSYPSGKMSIYFFDDDTLKKYTWDMVRKKNLLLQRKDITYPELENKNFVVSFP